MEKIFKNKKGQAIALDLAISITIFMIILAALLTVGGNQTTGGEKELLQQEMYSNAEKTMDFLTRSTGELNSNPPREKWESGIDSTCSNWPATDNVVFVGLAGKENVLVPQKVAAFVKCSDYINRPVSYTAMKSKILMNYNYYFRLLDSKGNVVEDPVGTKLMTGRLPVIQDINTSIILRRAVSYEGTDYLGEAIAELQVYR
jgi:hypothetical protein